MIRIKNKIKIRTGPADESLDTPAPVLFLPPVHLMPTIKVMSAQRGQGHSSCWRAVRAFGIVRNID